MAPQSVPPQKHGSILPSDVSEFQPLSKNLEKPTVLAILTETPLPVPQKIQPSVVSSPQKTEAQLVIECLRELSIRKRTPDREIAPVAPMLTSTQIQMLLGTLLGDGCMSHTTKHPSYQSNHGWCQHEYNSVKAQILSEYVRTPPKKMKNSGYGEWSSYFSTLSNPVFEFIRPLCYRKVETRYKKIVNQTWLDQLTWEGIAWWYMDDGSFQVKGPTPTSSFHTEGFSQEENELLQRWLTSKGIECGVHQYRKEDRGPYWYILCTVQGTLKLVEKISSYILPYMQYKIKLPYRQISDTCVFCGRTYLLTSSMAKSETRDVEYPCCQANVCLRARHRLVDKKYSLKPESQELRRRADVKRYWENPEKARAEASAWTAAHRDEVNQRKRARHAVFAAENPLVITCTRCQKTFAEPGREKHGLRYCPPCKAIVTREQQKTWLKQHSSPEEIAHRNHLQNIRQRKKAASKPTKTFVCELCAKTLVYTLKKPKFCKDCRAESQRQRSYLTWQKKAANAPTKTFVCEICAKEAVYTRMKPKFCEDCRAEAQKQRARLHRQKSSK